MKKKISITLIMFMIVMLISNAAEIHEAVKNNDLMKAKTLLSNNPALIHATDNYERTPLHWACRDFNIEMTAYLIESGAEVNALDINNIAPIHSSASRGNIEATRLLINHGAEVNINGPSKNTALHYASMDGRKDMVLFLLEMGANIESLNTRQRTPLLLAARENGGIDVIKALSEKGANINAIDAYGDTPLTLAAWRGYEDVVNYLLEKNAYIPTEGQKGVDVIRFALNKRLWQLYKAISLKVGKLENVLPKGVKPLNIAAKGGSEDIVLDLIKRGCDVNEKDIYGYSPMHYAAKYGRKGVIKILLENDADIDATTVPGESPYNLALKEEMDDIVNYLASKDAKKEVPIITNIQAKYFGQPDPGRTPALFAPGIVSNLVGGHSNVVFSSDGSEALWTEWNEKETGYADGCRIWYTQVKNGYWTVPEILLKYGDTPVYSTDDTKVFFMGRYIPENSEESVNQIMYFEKEGDSFSEPIFLEFDLTGSRLYWQFTFDSNQNIYFTGREGICRSKYENGKYQAYEPLSEIYSADYIGGSPYISPDGSYLIFSSNQLPDSFGEIDLYIGFKKPDGSWSDPINMGTEINTPEIDMLPMVSLDGKYLFYRSTRNNIPGIYWVSADIIKELYQDHK